MKISRRHFLALLATLLVLTSAAPVHAQTSNTPPVVSVVRPATYVGCNGVFPRHACLKIKALATDPDGSVVEVRFFLDSDQNVIGVATNAPFEIVWYSLAGGSHTIQAKAYDNLGASSESPPFSYFFTEFGSRREFEILSPADGSIFASPATFEFRAELLTTMGCNTGPVEFFVGTNLVGIATQSGPFTVSTPPYSLTVTNLAEGDYQLSLRKDSLPAASYAPGSCDGVFIHVRKLGINTPRLKSDGRFEFEVVTSFPTNQNVIEASSNLLNWTAISTNVPLTNTFTFTDPSPATNAPRFYRAVVPFE